MRQQQKIAMRQQQEIAMRQQQELAICQQQELAMCQQQQAVLRQQQLQQHDTRHQKEAMAQGSASSYYHALLTRQGKI